MPDLFLVLIALVWLIIASISDLKKREVPNWLNFSLIAFALTYRAFYAFYFSDLMFFVFGLLGLGIFIALAYGFYYARVFAGGDAKLLMGLGLILVSSSFNSLIYLAFFAFLLLFSGGIYGMIYSSVLALINWKSFSREFINKAEANKKFISAGIILSVFSLIFVFYFKEYALLLLSAVILLFPALFVYGKAVEEACLIKIVHGKELTIGDLLYEDVKLRKGAIKQNWEGLNEKELELLKTKNKVKIKQGIPFVPAFLIALVLLLAFEDFLLNLAIIF